MPFINFESQEKTFKIVYWGPSGAGKTENLKSLSVKIREDRRGDLIILATETEHTAYFEFLAVSLGTMHEFNIRLHLFSVPGAQGYESSRTMILRGADAVIFVADNEPARAQETCTSYRDLLSSLADTSSAADIPVVIQHNKADLIAAVPVFAASSAGDLKTRPQVSATASQGQGVFETLRCAVGPLI